MIKVNELRIGNYIQNDFSPSLVFQVDMLYLEGIIKVGYSGNNIKAVGQIDLLKPVKLTKDWLINFGYVRDNFLEQWMHKDDGVGIIISESDKKNNDEISFFIEFYYCFVQLESVHQLQNIYFALTGKELTITKR